MNNNNIITFFFTILILMFNFNHIIVNHCPCNIMHIYILFE